MIEADGSDGEEKAHRGDNSDEEDEEELSDDEIERRRQQLREKLINRRDEPVNMCTCYNKCVSVYILMCMLI